MMFLMSLVFRKRLFINLINHDIPVEYVMYSTNPLKTYLLNADKFNL